MTSPDFVPYLVAASTVIWLNENTAINGSGYAVPLSDTSGLIFQGYATNKADNTAGSAGAKTVNVNLIGTGADGRIYIFDCLTNTQAWVGALVYATDDHTVALSSSHSVVAGRVIQLNGTLQVLVDTMQRA